MDLSTKTYFVVKRNKKWIPVQINTAVNEHFRVTFVLINQTTVITKELDLWREQNTSLYQITSPVKKANNVRILKT